MDTQNPTPRCNRGGVPPRNHAWIVWTISAAVYVALMLGTLLLTETPT